MTLPTDAKERKAIPLWRGTFGYFPDALSEVARLCMVANEKHNPGEPMHWSRGKSTDHEDCLLRHMLDAEQGVLDADGFLPEVNAAWRALAKAQLALEKRKNSGMFAVVRGAQTCVYTRDPRSGTDRRATQMGMSLYPNRVRRRSEPYGRRAADPKLKLGGA